MKTEGRVSIIYYISVAVGLLGSALRLAGGVGEREDHRPVVVLAHLTQDLGSEGSANRSRAWKTTIMFFYHSV